MRTKNPFRVDQREIAPSNYWVSTWRGVLVFIATILSCVIWQYTLIIAENKLGRFAFWLVAIIWSMLCLAIYIVALWMILPPRSTAPKEERQISAKAPDSDLKQPFIFN